MNSYQSVSSRKGPSESPGSAKQRQPSGSSNHWTQIAINWFIITIPICALTAVLLGLVFHYRIDHGQSPFETLRGNLTQDETDVYYVDINPSIILWIASWASSLAPMLSGFILTLASFPIARQIFQNVQAERSHRLLTPYQLALTLKFLDGSVVGGIWSWILYRIGWDKRRAPQAGVLTAACSVAIFVTALGFLVALADTWLHLTTTAVPFTQLSRAGDNPNYSFGLVPRCLRSNNSIAAQYDIPLNSTEKPCAVGVAGNGLGYLIDPKMAIKALHNASDLATVYTYQAPNNPIPYTYFGVPSSPDNLDYTAHTYGAGTECWLMSRQCSLTTDNPGVAFNCSGWDTSMSDSEWLLAPFTDRTMTQLGGHGNPYYYAAAGSFGLSGSGAPNNEDFVKLLHGGWSFILGCNSTVYDIEYDRVNGSISRFDSTPSNISVSNIWETITIDITEGNYAMQEAISRAALSDTAQEFADSVAFAFSQTYLALGAETLERRPTHAVQDRRVSLVARVPTAPLITLVVVNMLYVLCGFVFAAVALLVSAGSAGGVPDIQLRLTVAGLVADRFEEQREINSAEELFEEHAGKESRRVAIVPASEGGYEYSTLHPVILHWLDFPPPRTQYREFFLSQGALNDRHFASHEQISYDSESPFSFAEFSYTFDKPARLIGLPKAVLYMSADEQDDFTVFVIIRKKDKNGKPLRHLNFPFHATPVNSIDDIPQKEQASLNLHLGSTGILRASHRAFDKERSIHPQFPFHPHTKQEKVAPGEIVKLEIGIWAMGVHFDAGETVCVRVSGQYPSIAEYKTWSKPRPQHELNKGRHIVHCGTEYPRSITLPFI
ncbi:hypothetical protein BDV18DRAFT_161786 [Aspergillus unguis]